MRSLPPKVSDLNHTSSNGNLPHGTVAVVVVAAGSGTRLGASLPKALVELDGQSLIDHVINRVASMASSVELVVVAPQEVVEQLSTELKAIGSIENLRVVAGGESRHESVSAGLQVVSEGVRIVLVHDAARALTPAAQFDAVVTAIDAGAQVAIPGLDVVDTVKRVELQSGEVLVRGTVERQDLRLVQTPQGFDRSVIVELHKNAGDSSPTDDAGLAEAADVPVVVVPGLPEAFKITTPEDLVFAEFVLKRQSENPEGSL